MKKQYRFAAAVIGLIISLAACCGTEREAAQEKRVSVKSSSTKKETEEGQLEEIRPLKEIYREYFRIGIALNPETIKDQYRETVTKHFNSATCENNMKPDAILDQEGSRALAAKDPAAVAVSFDRCREETDYCAENNLKMRFHTLVWQNQTPVWFFHQNYDPAEAYADAETMKARMKNYITAVISYLDTEYPDLIYAVDVVNEAFNGEGPYRITDSKNLWYDTIGWDYPYYAFLYAREALDNSRNMKDIELVYNDYGMIWKADTVAEGLEAIFAEHGAKAYDYVDAVGFQAHLSVTDSVEGFEKALRRIGDAGYGLQITELDISILDIPVGQKPSDDALKKQEDQYRAVMHCLASLKNQGYPISSVSVWGFSDDQSWLRNKDGMDCHALLWGRGMTEKPALRGIASGLSDEFLCLI